MNDVKTSKFLLHFDIKIYKDDINDEHLFLFNEYIQSVNEGNIENDVTLHTNECKLKKQIIFKI